MTLIGRLVFACAVVASAGAVPAARVNALKSWHIAPAAAAPGRR